MSSLCQSTLSYVFMFPDAVLFTVPTKFINLLNATLKTFIKNKI